MPAIHPDCQPLAIEIEALQQEIEALQQDLRSAAPNQKPAIATQIKKLNAQLFAKRADLNQCIAAHPMPTAITSVFTGAVRLRYHYGQVREARTSMKMSLTFSASRLSVELSMPALVFVNIFQYKRSFFTYKVSVSLTIEGKAVGTHDPATHDIHIPLTYKLTPSVSGYFSGWFKRDPSLLTLDPPGLTTGKVVQEKLGWHVYGFPLDMSTGSVKFAGGGVAKGGFLDGYPFVLDEMIGILSPLP